MASFPCIEYVDENYNHKNYKTVNLEDCQPPFEYRNYNISEVFTNFLEPERVISWLAIPIERRAAIQELAEFLCENPDELLTGFPSVTI